MSRLTSCCGCAGTCDDPLPPDWTVLLPEGTEVVGGALNITSQGGGGVTSIDGIAMVVATANWTPAKKTAASFNNAYDRTATVPASTTIEIPLWCNASGNEAQVQVRLKADVGEKFVSQFPGLLAPVMPESHIVMRDADGVTTNPYLDPEDVIRSSWRAIVLTLELEVQGSLRASVQVPAISRTRPYADYQYGSARDDYLNQIGIQVFAARDGDEVDVSVAISDSFELGPAYVAGTSRKQTNVVRSMGLVVPTQWHLFDTVQDLDDPGQNTMAGVLASRMEQISEPALSQGSVLGMVLGYQIAQTSPPGIPPDTAKWCDPQSQEFTPPESMQGNTDEVPWETLPWVHTPCTRWKRVSRVTQFLNGEQVPTTLSIRFPNPEGTVFNQFPGQQQLLGLGLLGNTIELTGFRNGIPLADNCFWYEDEPGIETESEICRSVQVSAVVGAEVGVNDSRVPYYYPVPPCDEANWNYGWRATIFLEIVSIIGNKETGQDRLFHGSAALSMYMNSKFMRGQEIRTYGPEQYGFVGSNGISFIENGWRRVWPDYLSTGFPWLCYTILPPPDYDDPNFAWWRVKIL